MTQMRWTMRRHDGMHAAYLSPSLLPPIEKTPEANDRDNCEDHHHKSEICIYCTQSQTMGDFSMPEGEEWRAHEHLVQVRTSPIETRVIVKAYHSQSAYAEIK